MARVSNRPRYWLTPVVKLPPAVMAVHVIEDSTQDLDTWRNRKPQAPKGAVEGVKIRLTQRPYRAGETVSMADTFGSEKAVERFKGNGFTAIPEILPDEAGTDLLLG